uniref:Uncharacterized protein n=1 Tax=Panagrolaimus sp. JU765 TaxID=591449 RepID=A0AC34QW17_9BILA
MDFRLLILVFFCFFGQTIARFPFNSYKFYSVEVESTEALVHSFTTKCVLCGSITWLPRKGHKEMNTSDFRNLITKNTELNFFELCKNMFRDSKDRKEHSFVLTYIEEDSWLEVALFCSRNYTYCANAEPDVSSNKAKWRNNTVSDRKDPFSVMIELQMLATTFDINLSIHAEPLFPDVVFLNTKGSKPRICYDRFGRKYQSPVTLPGCALFESYYDNKTHLQMIMDTRDLLEIIRTHPEFEIPKNYLLNYFYTNSSIVPRNESCDVATTNTTFAVYCLFGEEMQDIFKNIPENHYFCYHRDTPTSFSYIQGEADTEEVEMTHEIVSLTKGEFRFAELCVSSFEFEISPNKNKTDVEPSSDNIAINVSGSIYLGRQNWCNQTTNVVPKQGEITDEKYIEGAKELYLQSFTATCQNVPMPKFHVCFEIDSSQVFPSIQHGIKSLVVSDFFQSCYHQMGDRFNNNFGCFVYVDLGDLTQINHTKFEIQPMDPNILIQSGIFGTTKLVHLENLTETECFHIYVRNQQHHNDACKNTAQVSSYPKTAGACYIHKQFSDGPPPINTTDIKQELETLEKPKNKCFTGIENGKEIETFGFYCRVSAVQIEGVKKKNYTFWETTEFKLEDRIDERRCKPTGKTLAVIAKKLKKNETGHEILRINSCDLTKTSDIKTNYTCCCYTGKNGCNTRELIDAYVGFIEQTSEHVSRHCEIENAEVEANCSSKKITDADSLKCFAIYTFKEYQGHMKPEKSREGCYTNEMLNVVSGEGAVINENDPEWTMCEEDFLNSNQQNEHSRCVKVYTTMNSADGNPQQVIILCCRPSHFTNGKKSVEKLFFELPDADHDMSSPDVEHVHDYHRMI